MLAKILMTTSLCLWPMVVVQISIVSLLMMKMETKQERCLM